MGWCLDGEERAIGRGDGMVDTCGIISMNVMEVMNWIKPLMVCENSIVII